MLKMTPARLRQIVKESIDEAGQDIWKGSQRYERGGGNEWCYRVMQVLQSASDKLNKIQRATNKKSDKQLINLVNQQLGKIFRTIEKKAEKMARSEFPIDKDEQEFYNPKQDASPESRGDED